MIQETFINKEIVDNSGHMYKVLKHIGSGAIGHMFYCKNEEFESERAIKIIPKESLRNQWENEIIKVNKLKIYDKVVRYYTHGEIEHEDRLYLYIMWDYIKNESLKSMIEKSTVTMPILFETVINILEVLHACSVDNIIHADLHAGNILIEKENPHYIDPSYRKIWVTDFGYIAQNSDREYLDDYAGLNRLIQEALRVISFNGLDEYNKKLHRYLNNEFSRCLLETNPTVDDCVRNPLKLLARLRKAMEDRKIEKQEIERGIGDYLAAEHLGDDFEEWKAIFVPKFIAIEELLEKNICLLTGLRGCGKTMLFKRLSSYFNLKIGERADLKGSDNFYGFYLNARNIAESFPWLPDYVEENAHNQVINNFNLNWSLEVIIWLRELAKSEYYDLTFLNIFFKKYYPKFFSAGNSQNINYLIELIRSEIANSRLLSKYEEEGWPLSQYDFLEELVLVIKDNLGLETNKPFYFFLDDYSLPMVKATSQRILNPIIFRRSANVIFKISTESIESFEPVGLNGKTLEENDDYRLIDCGTITLGKSKGKDCREILFSILKPRIERHPLLRNRNLTLENMLGKTCMDNEKRARIIRGETTEEEVRDINIKYLYQGCDVFCDMWCSDIREMINLFADMVSKESNSRLSERNDELISDAIQNEVYKESGGQFMSLLGAATNPSEKSLAYDRENDYAKHLIDIVTAFQEIASYLLINKNSKNLNSNPAKKVRRIEITNVSKDLEGDAKDYYRGLIRYGIFIRDYRGKSVRGKIVPRLYLRSRLIPYFRLTYSKRDSVTMSWEEFIEFLLTPKEFVNKFIKKSKNGENNNSNCYGQMSMFGKEE